MTRAQKIVGAILAVIGALAIGASVASAASFFATTVQTSAATTTPAYMTPGLATTTLTYNTYTNNSIATATPTGTNQAVASVVYLAGQFTGSSTAATLKVTPEYSNDGIDWYQGYSLNSGYSTTSPNQTFVYAASDTVTMPFASTSPGGAAGTQGIDRFLLKFQVPTKDVRFVVTLTGANGAFWGQVVPTKQTQ